MDVNRIKKPRNMIIGFALMALVAWNLMMSPGVYPAASRMVMMTGYLLPAEMADAPGAYTLRHGDQRWVFRLTDVRIPRSQSQETSDYAVMKRLGRERLTLMGSMDTIVQLDDPDRTCREITLHGTLYTSNNALALFRIDETPEGKPVDSCI
jgi:hypothetical protein